MKNSKYLLNYYINANLNWFYGRTPYYWDRGKYNKAYWIHFKAKRIKQIIK